MDQLKLHHLEKLLEVPTARGPVQANDISVLTCGCLVSESEYTLENANPEEGICPHCSKIGQILAPIEPLRELYVMLKELRASQSHSKSRRHSSSKKSIQDEQRPNMDLLGLFYNYAREDPKISTSAATNAIPIPNASDSETQLVHSSVARALTSLSLSPEDRYTDSMVDNRPSTAWETVLLSGMNEQSEYNFSKCFPLYRQLTSYQTPLLKSIMSALPFRLGSAMIRKSFRYLTTCIHSYIDRGQGREVSRYVLLSPKRWEIHLINNDTKKTSLISCGKSSGEFGSDPNLVAAPLLEGIVIRNDFSGSSSSTTTEDIKRRLNLWEMVQCRLSQNLLLLSGSRGTLRLLDINGAPLYTYVTNFPIRCIAISPSENLIACAITAKERVSGKEQPFIILHKLHWNNLYSNTRQLVSVEPITITIPYRDPIKLINFNLSLSHLVCCTVWESRYFVVKLSGKGAGDFNRPRLVWTDVRDLGRDPHPSSDRGDRSSEDDVMMDNEGITDIQFGKSGTNTVVLTFCSLKNRPPLVIQLEGETMDHNYSHGDVFSLAISGHSSNHSYKDDEDEDFDRSSAIKSASPLFKIHQVGTYIHRVALLPRGDGMAFLDREGRIFVAATPNFSSRQAKRLVVLLGETMGAERFTLAASIRFSADGSKIIVVDRRGLVQIFDFAKGVPGSDVDVIKCKLISS